MKNIEIAALQNIVPICQHARQLTDTESMKAAKAFISWKIDQNGDGAAVTALFADAMNTGRKAIFIKLLTELEQAAAAIVAAEWDAKRAARVIARCAEEGLTGVTVAQVEATAAARADRYYSVGDAVAELLEAADADPEKSGDLARYTVFSRAWYRDPVNDAERARYPSGRVPNHDGDETIIADGVTWGEAKRRCNEFNANVPEDDFYSVKYEFRDE